MKYAHQLVSTMCTASCQPRLARVAIGGTETASVVSETGPITEVRFGRLAAGTGQAPYLRLKREIRLE